MHAMIMLTRHGKVRKAFRNMFREARREWRERTRIVRRHTLTWIIGLAMVVTADAAAAASIGDPASSDVDFIVKAIQKVTKELLSILLTVCVG